jgi:hypothetical protein
MNHEKIEPSVEIPWDPDEAKKTGSLKGIAEFKIEAEHSELTIEFTEPKAKKKIKTSTNVINTKKSKNKNSLF